MKIIKLITLTLVLVTSSVIGATYTSNSSTFGDWDIGGDPGSTDNIVINHDWSGNDAGTLGSWRANYSGTMTINSGGYFQIDQGLTNWTGTIDVKAGGSFASTSSTAFDAGGSVNVDGYAEFSGSFTNNDAITGSGVLVSNVSIGGSGSIAGTINTLPVELVYFSSIVEGSKVVLSWTTLSEVNNDYFEVQKSIDGNRFVTIGIVSGNGNSVEENKYSFIDDELNGNALYRLKQVDYDGAFEFSNVIALKAEGVVKKPEIIQVENSSEVIVVSNSINELTYTVYSINGTLVKQLVIEGKEGTRLNDSIEGSGSYIVTVLAGQTLVSKTIIVR